MKRALAAPLCGAAMLLLPAQRAFAATGCAPTPDAAVLQAIGSDDAAAKEQQGFRVRDIVVDPLLHRAFVHVEQCGHPERPLVLLPFSSARDAALNVPPGALAVATATNAAGLAMPSGSVVAVSMGDAHMHLTTTGRLLQSAPLGSVVDVQLASLDGSSSQGDQVKRVRGTLIAADRVEVQP